MADINSGGNSDGSEARLGRNAHSVDAQDLLPSETTGGDAVVAILELFYFAYRDFTGEADAELSKFGFGRAHHRVLHFVSRNPGIRVADLLDILKITKQSLARVLKQLVDEAYVEQMAGMSDRRERRLYVTFKGESLARELMALQCRRITEALTEAGPASRSTAERFLFGMISPQERQQVLQLLRGSNPVLDQSK